MEPLWYPVMAQLRGQICETEVAAQHLVEIDPKPQSKSIEHIDPKPQSKSIEQIDPKSPGWTRRGSI
uniref:Uncharacterized protein n=1 Tax=Triticum urartu TaxID=4572 RepID=A0A8R7K232_TRIUA